MATYLQGITDYLPQVQPWTPNFNFYQSVLERKQNKYDQGWQQVNSLYNSILNAPMMREQNIQRRDKFFQDIESQIDQIASVDLSLPQNVQIAGEVFKPFYEDENIVKDIGFTKKYQDELTLAETYRKCMTKECKGKYWQGGVRALNHQAADFIKASDEEALRMKAPEYTPYVNFMDKASKAVKDAGLSMKFDTKQGGYIVTTKNGPALQMPLMNFLMTRFGDDPELQQFYGTKAYLLTKENPDQAALMYQQALRTPQASGQQIERAAQNQGMMNTYNDSKYTIEAGKERESNRFLSLVKKKRVIENRLSKTGFIPGSKEHNEFIQLSNDVDLQQSVVDKINGYSEDVRLTDEGISQFGIMGNEEQMRNVIAHGLKMNDMHNAAVSLSYRGYERTMREDKYSLEAYRQKNRLSLASVKHQQAKDLATHKNILDIKNKQLEYQIKEGIIDPTTLKPYADQQGDLRDPVIFKPGEGERPVDNTTETLRLEGKPVEAWGNLYKNFSGLTDTWKGNSTAMKRDLNNKYAQSIFNTAADKGNADRADAAQVELSSLGNELQKKFDKYDRYIKYGQTDKSINPNDPDIIAIQNLSPEVRERLKAFPSDTKNIENLDTKYFNSILNDIEDIKNVVGGDNKFYSFISEGEGTWVPHPETGKSVLKADIAPKMSEMQIQNLREKASNIGKDKYDAVMNDRTYSGPELTKNEQETLDLIEYLETAGSYSRNYGLGSKDSYVSKMKQENVENISYINMLDKTYEKNIRMFNSAGDNAFTATAQHYSGDEFWTGEGALAKVIWKKGEGTSKGTVRSKAEAINKVIESGTKETGSWWSGTRGSLMDIGQDHSLTITQGEERYGVQFNTDNILKLLTESEYVASGAAGGFESVKFWDLGADLQELAGEENLYAQSPTDLMNAIYENRHMLDITRDAGKLNVKIKDRFASQGVDTGVYSFDIENVEVNDAVWEVVDDVDKSYNVVLDRFLQEFQTQDSPIGAQDLGGQMGSFAAPGIGFTVNPKIRDNNYVYATNIVKDAILGDKISGSGNTDMLNTWYTDITTMRASDIKHEDSPIANISFLPVYGKVGDASQGGTSKLKVTYSDAYLKSKGYNTGKKDSPVMKATHEYIIEGSDSDLYRLSTPNPFQTLLKEEGSTYSDNLGDMGTITYSNVGNGMIQVETEARYFDPNLGEYTPVNLEPYTFNIENYTWELNHNNNIAKLKTAEAVNNARRKQYIEQNGSRDVNVPNQ